MSAAVERTRTADVLALTGFLLLVLAVSGIGGWLTSTSVRGWYPALVKPPGTPPPWVFGPVWTVLYILMAVAGWGVWRGPAGPARRRALAAWGVQLALNLGWSFLFFYLRQPLAGGIEIVLLAAAIVAAIVAAVRVRRWAAWLLAPYLGWVCYAAYLNWGIWVLN